MTQSTELDPNFVETIQLLNERKLPYWVCHGTLLGLVREGNLIPWDHDVDIAVWAEQVTKQEAITLMLNQGYSLKSDGEGYDFLQFVKPGGRDVDFNFYHTKPDEDMAYSEWFMERNSFTRFLGALSDPRTYHGKKGRYLGWLRFLSSIFKRIVSAVKKMGIYYKSAGYTTPAHLLRSLTDLEIYHLKVRVPEDYQGVLEFLYGKDWRQPKSNYDWTKESPATRITYSRFKEEELKS